MELARSVGVGWAGVGWAGAGWAGADLAVAEPSPRSEVSVRGLATGRSTAADVDRDNPATLFVLPLAASAWLGEAAVEWLAGESEARAPVPVSAAAIPVPSRIAMPKPPMSSNAHRQNLGPPATVVPQRRAVDLQQTLANGSWVRRVIKRCDAGYTQVRFNEGAGPVDRRRRVKRVEHTPPLGRAHSRWFDSSARPAN